MRSSSLSISFLSHTDTQHNKHNTTTHEDPREHCHLRRNETTHSIAVCVPGTAVLVWVWDGVVTSRSEGSGPRLSPPEMLGLGIGLGGHGLGLALQLWPWPSDCGLGLLWPYKASAIISFKAVTSCRLIHNITC